MKLGMVIGGPLAGIPSAAKAVEDAGFDTVWTAETGTTAFVPAVLAAQATGRVRVGTAIALAFPRSPSIAAMTAVDIDELSGGRFILGLGSQVKRVNEDRFSTAFEHPAPKMREYTLATRAFISGYAGQDPSFEGRFYRVTLAPWPRATPLARTTIPVFLAAVNRHMLRVAGEVADGVVGHPMTSVEYIRASVLPQIEHGAKKAGRDPSEIELSQGVIMSISHDRDLAKREVKGQIGFYATTRTYTPVLAAHGFDDVVPSLREAYARKDMEAVRNLVSDEMADTFGIYGTAEEVAEKVKKFDGLVDELMLGGAWYKVDPARVMENYSLMLQTFSR